jgi:hypothetical protein
VISPRDPEVRITVPSSAHYVGTDRFVLSDPKLGKFDDCELFSFVDSDDGRHVRKFYWIQFEAYLPDHPHLHHTYDSPRHAEISGLDFYVDTWVSPATHPPGPGSDEAHFYALLGSYGYRRGDFISVRLVHLIDAKRKEVMIIYAESLAGTGFAAAQLATGGSKHAEWTAIEKRLIGRAERSITIRTGAGT